MPTTDLSTCSLRHSEASPGAADTQLCLPQLRFTRLEVNSVSLSEIQTGRSPRFEIDRAERVSYVLDDTSLGAFLSLVVTDQEARSDPCDLLLRQELNARAETFGGGKPWKLDQLQTFCRALASLVQGWPPFYPSINLLEPQRETLAALGIQTEDHFHSFSGFLSTFSGVPRVVVDDGSGGLKDVAVYFTTDPASKWRMEPSRASKIPGRITGVRCVECAPLRNQQVISFFERC